MNNLRIPIAITMMGALILTGYFMAATAAGSSPDVQGQGAVTGVVRFDGPAPKPVRIVMAADQSCARAHPAGTPGEELLVGANGSLGNVIVYIADGLAGKSYAPPSAPVTMEQTGCMYQPHILALQANQKLRIVNNDGTLHNIHPIPQNNREWNKAQPPGMQPVEESFPREEIAIPIKCNIHPWMKSYVAVFKHPYFAVTSKDGSFDIPNLPPGTYTLAAWHEKFGTQTKKISVGPNGADKVDFVFKSPMSH